MTAVECSGTPSSQAPGTLVPPTLLAVDGGNSKTEVVLVASDGKVLGTGRGGPSCHQMVGMQAAMANLTDTVSAAYTMAGWTDSSDRPPARLGVYCLAGLDLPIDLVRLDQALGERSLSQDRILHNDTMAVFRAGATSPWGVGLVCGAGNNCAALAPDGQTVRFPSLGELSGDFTTGGTWLGTRALGLALRAGDGRGPKTLLRRTVPAHLGLATPEEVLEAVYTGELPFDRLLDLAPLVLEAASAGDAGARATADLLADELAGMARAAITRLDLGNLKVEVVLGGGVFQTTDSRFHQRVRQGILAVAPNARFVALAAPPVLGAALLGADALSLGTAAGEKLRASLRTGLSGGGL